MNKVMSEFLREFERFAFDEDGDRFSDFGDDERMDLSEFEDEPYLLDDFFGELPNEKSLTYIKALFLDEAEKVQDAQMRKRIMEYGDGYAKYLNERLAFGFYGRGVPDGKWLSTDGTNVIRRVIRYIFAEILNIPHEENGLGMNDFRLIRHDEGGDSEYLFHGLSFNYWDIVEGITDEDGREKEFEDITDEDIVNELWCSVSCGCGYFPEE